MIKTNDDADEAKNVWQWLDEQGYRYDVDREGWQSPCELFFFTDRTTYLKPGEIIFFLRTGHVRDMAIFHPSVDGELLRKHRDGTCVSIKRIK